MCLRFPHRMEVMPWIASRLAVVLIIVATASCCRAETRSVARPSEALSCQRFAQHFYDWYSSFEQQESQQSSASSALEVSAGVALRDRPSWFSQTLRIALQKDLDAQSKSDELVGIDFDPFFGSQDPADHYALRNPVVDGDFCSIQVWRDSKTDTAAKTGKPEAVAQLALRNGHWAFIDLRYPDSKASCCRFLRSFVRSVLSTVSDSIWSAEQKKARGVRAFLLE